MRKVLWLFSVLFVLQIYAQDHQLKKTVDTQGYTYEYVTDDPYNARIYTLANGMHVYLSRIPVKPRITMKWVVGAGMAQSPADATGLAHYFEHLMFKGTDRIGTLDYQKEKPLLDRIEELFEQRRRTSDPAEKSKIYREIDRLSSEAARFATAGEYSKLISSIGGMNLNAMTASDWTAYVADIPSNELEKLLLLEAERLRNPVMRLFHTELETIFEEFNQGQDDDSVVAREAMMHALFPRHPYGWIPNIGKPEHLKSPSIRAIRTFFEKYYVPANMALLLAGDLDFEKTIRMVDTFFGIMPAKKLVREPLPQEKPMTENQKIVIPGPQAEFVLLGYRLPADARNELLGTLLSQILRNGVSGIMDSTLLRAQKLQQAFAMCWPRRDYMTFIMHGQPGRGQTLEEVSGLLQSALKKVQDGDFPDWLLPAVILDYRIYLEQTRDEPENAAWTYLNSFVCGRSYLDSINLINHLEQITKEELCAFARSLKYHVRVDKIQGKADQRSRVEKPGLTPVELNAGKMSAYGREFLSRPASPLPPFSPVVPGKDFEIQDIAGTGSRIFYSRKPAPSNHTLFSLSVFIDAGSKYDLRLPLACNYLKYVGTDQFTADEMRNEFYKIGVNFAVETYADKTEFRLSGLQTRMTAGLDLLRHFLMHMKADEPMYRLYVKQLLKKREDRKKDFQEVFSALNHYAAYGPGMNNPKIYSAGLGEKELNSIRPDELLRFLQSCFVGRNAKVTYSYCGPASLPELQNLLKKHACSKDEKLQAPLLARKEFRLLPTEQSRVYLLPYDSVQMYLGFRRRGEKMNLDDLPLISVFNQYFGIGGLNSVVFQEIREARSLAYSAYAYYRSASRKGRHNVFGGFIGTQPDKVFDALNAMRDLLKKLPYREADFIRARDSRIKQMASERLFGQLYEFHEKMVRLGVDYDWREKEFQALPKVHFSEVEKFFRREVAVGVYDWYIAGDLSRLDRRKLDQLGVVREITLKEAFGY